MPDWSESTCGLAVVVGLAATLAAGCRAPAPASVALDPESLPRGALAWSPAELEVGLAHWDVVFPGREVARGLNVAPLPVGPPLMPFSAGGPRAGELERFMSEQRTAGLIVLHGGQVRLERYGLGHSATGRWTSQSVAKSVTSTLVGAAVLDGFISSLDDPVTTYLPGLRGGAYDHVSVRHLLTMTSGVRWDERYGGRASDLSRFYSAPVEPGLGATVSYMRGLAAQAAPGTTWGYKTGETHLLGVLVAAATKRPLADYLSAKIWAPYGMEQSATWSLDRTDDELAGCCLQAALRDYARYGQFVLDGGRVQGRSIVPDGWFEAATRTQVPTGDAGRGYGYQWWTGDDETFRAIGIHGQLIYIDPARRLVVAINSAWPEATSRRRSAAQAELLSAISQAIDEDGGLGDRRGPA